MNTICWFQRKEEGISRANKQSIYWQTCLSHYSTMAMLAQAHFLHPPFNTSLWHECFMHIQSLAGLQYCVFFFLQKTLLLSYYMKCHRSNKDLYKRDSSGLWLLQLSRYSSVKMTQSLRTLEAKRKKNSNINNEVKEKGGKKTKPFITNEKTGRASHCENANDNQLAIPHDLGCVGV